MIAPAVLAKYGPHIPVNACAHCSEVDDPETTRGWPEDDDGDRICRSCEAVENKSRVLPGSAGWDGPQGFAVGQARESLPTEGSGPITRGSLSALENSQQPGRARDDSKGETT